MVYQLNRPRIEQIIDYCNDMKADEKLEVFEFGENNDLALHIYKDSDANGDAYNMVTISTAKNGKFVDDTDDIYVTDGSLYKELMRINSYKNYCLK